MAQVQVVDSADIGHEILSRVDQLGLKLAEVAPVAYQKLVLYKQAESVAYLIVGGFCLVLAMLDVVVMFRNLEKANNGEGIPAFKVAIGGVLAVGFGISSLCCLLYVWNWIGAFVPEARLINDLWSGLTQSR